jgi:hypothetical protein
MKRVVLASLISLFIILTLGGIYFYFRNYRTPGGNPVKAIPSDAAFFFVYNPVNSSPTELIGNSYWKTLGVAPAINRMTRNFNFIDSLINKNELFAEYFAQSPVFISAHVIGAGDFDFLILKGIDGNNSDEKIDGLIQELAGESATIETRNYDGNNIREILLPGNRIFAYTIVKGIFMGSFTTFLVEDALRQVKLGKPSVQDYEFLDSRSSTSSNKLFISFDNFSSFLSLFTNPATTARITALKNYAGWSVFEVESYSSRINFSGYLTNNDSLKFIHSLAGQEPVEKKLIEILPLKTASFLYFGLSDFRTHYMQLSRQHESSNRNNKTLQALSDKYKIEIEEQMLDWIGNEYALLITEPAGVNYDNNSYGIFHAKDIKEARKKLRALSQAVDKKYTNSTLEESYNKHTIGYIRLQGVLPAMFGLPFSRITKMYYTTLNEYVVFANQASSLRSIIDDYEAGNLLRKEEGIMNKFSGMPLTANLIFYSDVARSQYIFRNAASSKWKQLSDKYSNVISGINSLTYQVNMTGDFTEHYANISFKKEGSYGTSLLFAVEADTSVSMEPLLTTDPSGIVKQIVFQDDANNLYLTGNDGNIIWTQEIDGKIQGKIYEVDLFKNNSRQFLFNTPTHLHMLDSEGKPVGNYPIRLPAPASNGSVVVYFKDNKDPVIYIACENGRVYAYQIGGRPLAGWNFPATEGKITEQVLPFNFKGRDLLLIHDNTGKVSVVNRLGEPGIPISQKFQIALNSNICLPSEQDSSFLFVTTDSTGSIIHVSPWGTVRSIPLNISNPSHSFIYEDADADGKKDYIFLEGNELIAYNQELVMIYRKKLQNNMSGKIQSYILPGKLKVIGMISVEDNKIWLYKLDGTLYDGFPLKGSSPFVIDEINLDGKKNIIVGSKDHNVYVYSLR